MQSPNIPALMEAFLNERMIRQKQVSPHTLASYSDTFRLLLQYAEKELKKKLSDLTINDFNAQFLCRFLDNQEECRKICARTRNARLVAIRSFFNYLLYRLPGSGGLITEVLAIPEKRTGTKLIDFLTEEEVAALLNAPNREEWIGKRDYTFLVIAIQTGMRLAELTALKWKDVHLEQIAYIECCGKGRKNRVIPLSKESIKCLSLWSKETHSTSSDIVFPTIHNHKISADTVQYMLKKYSMAAAKHCHSLVLKKVTPHMLRHTTAMGLVQNNVELASVALWLGHESIKTTYMYLKADMAMKEKILKKLPPLNIKTSRYKPKAEIMTFLKNLSRSKSDQQ